MSASKEPAADLATERVVLRLVESDGPNEHWEVVGTARSGDKIAAIKQVANDEPGRYRAPSVRSWKGGMEIVLPAKPKIETRLFDA